MGSEHLGCSGSLRRGQSVSDYAKLRPTIGRLFLRKALTEEGVCARVDTLIDRYAAFHTKLSKQRVCNERKVGAKEGVKLSVKQYFQGQKQGRLARSVGEPGVASVQRTARMT